MTSHQCYLIAFGGNVPSSNGPPEQTLRASVEVLKGCGVRIETLSPFYKTPCFPRNAGPDYVNAAAKVAFQGDPDALLRVLHAVENDFDRKREQRWGTRTLDLDLIAAGAQVRPDLTAFTRWCERPPAERATRTPERLILPHPRLQERAFVLVPLSDVAPDWVHPVLKRTVSQMRDALPKEELDAVVRL